jgi:YesN/AraC family two-component response regulator
MTQALEQGSWDLVLSDIVMPQFTGADALELVGESGDDR